MLYKVLKLPIQQKFQWTFAAAFLTNRSASGARDWADHQPDHLLHHASAHDRSQSSHQNVLPDDRVRGLPDPVLGASRTGLLGDGLKYASGGTVYIYIPRINSFFCKVWFEHNKAQCIKQTMRVKWTRD